LANQDDYTIHFVTGSPEGIPIGDRAVWYMDEESGNLIGDSSGGGNEGILTGAPERVLGYSGRAIRFDGIGSRASAPDAPSLDFSSWPGATVAAWVKPQRLGHTEEQTIYGHWNDSPSDRTFQILLTLDDRLRCRTDHDVGYATSPAQVSVDTWVHVACVWTSTGLSLYVDGQLAATDAAVGSTLPSNSGDHTLGAREKSGDWSQHFLGILDEVHIFGRGLTAEEVARLHGSIPCLDSDVDGLRSCDGDCDDANPECSSACLDGDGDGICADRDCDDAAPSAGSVPFPESVLPIDRDTLR
jgi:hypothetical protein